MSNLSFESDTPVCNVCLEADGAILLGCACRGFAGVGHLECRVKAAVQKAQLTFPCGIAESTHWRICDICGHEFSGSMRLGMALKQMLYVQPGSPPEARAMLIAQNSLAMAYHGVGNYHRALIIHQSLLDTKLLTFGPMHLDTLMTQNNMTMALTALGRFKEAVTILTSLVPAFTALQGANAHQTLTAKSNLAAASCALTRKRRAYSTRAQHQRRTELVDAEVMLRDVLAIRLQQLGGDHPHVLSTRNNIADTLIAQEKFSEACSMLEDARVISNRVLGLDHPTSIFLWANLCIAMYANGNRLLAMNELKQVSSASRRVLGTEHPATRSTEAALNSWTRTASHSPTGKRRYVIPVD